MKSHNVSRPIFILTVDTEEEWDWGGSFPAPPFSTENIKYIPKFQEFCKSLNVFPTYFVDYAVVDNISNREILSHYFANGECDIGAHLHPWCTPPISEQISEHNSHALNLTIDLFEQKMISLTELMKESFNIHPFSFRSGRWGLNGQMLKVLAKLGYQVDSSVRPYYRDSCFDYHHAPTRPYWPSYNDIQVPDNSQKEILEIPTSSGFNHRWFEQMDSIHTLLSQSPVNKLRIIGILWKLGLMRKITVTPEGTTLKDLCRCIDMCVRRGDPVINLFFHSSDLMPGNTHYVKNADDLAAFYQTIECSLRHARSAHNAEFLTVRQAHEQLKVG